MPHHVTQRGNRRQQTFFGEEDYQHYLELISRFCRAEQVAIRAYCLMPNHVHLIVVPQSAESLRRAIGEAHRRYTRWINFREGWRGHLWQGRFASFVMDEDHLLTAARYVELNPVRAGLVQAPSRYRWSSAAAHLRRRDDVLVQVAPLLQSPWRRGGGKGRGGRGEGPTGVAGVLFVLRIKQPDLPRPYRTWGYPYTPLLYVATAVLLLGNMLVDPHSRVQAGGIGLILLGIPAWAILRRRPPRT